MSSLLLPLHDWLRWAILVAGAGATLRALAGWRRGGTPTALDDRLGRAFAVGLDLQLVVGVILWGGVSLVGGRALAAEGAAALADPDLRFYAVLHPLLGAGALALAHLGRIRQRRLAPGPARHRVAALLYGAAMLLLGAASA